MARSDARRDLPEPVVRRRHAIAAVGSDQHSVLGNARIEQIVPWHRHLVVRVFATGGLHPQAGRQGSSPARTDKRSLVENWHFIKIVRKHSGWGPIKFRGACVKCETSQLETAVTLHQCIVLIVEDEPLIRLDLAYALEDAGCRVLAARSVLEAIGLLAKVPYIDGLITDVDLPGGLSGLDLLDLVAACSPRAAMIVVSGRHDLEPVETLPRFRFFSKPYRLSELLSELALQIRSQKPESSKEARADRASAK